MANPNVQIRPFQTSDARSVFQAVQEALVQVPIWLPDLNADVTLDDVRAYIEAQPSMQTERKVHNFSIVDVTEGGILGGCGLTQINWQHRFGNRYYWVRGSRTGRGVAAAAALELSNKVNATREGLLRNRISVRGTAHDAFMYSLIPSDLAPSAGGTMLASTS